MDCSASKDIETANKQMIKCLTALVIKQMEVKTKRYLYISIRMIKIINKAGFYEQFCMICLQLHFFKNSS